MRGEGSTTWRYAITRELVDGADGKEPYYTIREIYTSEDGKIGWTAEAIAARGDSWLECINDLGLMTRAMGTDLLDLTREPPEWIRPREAKLRDQHEREATS